MASSVRTEERTATAAEGGEPDEAAQDVCERICRRLEESDALDTEADESWEREMEVVCALMQAAQDAVFQCWVRSKHFAKDDVSETPCTGKVVHFAARFGSRGALQLACGRTGASLGEAVRMATSEGSLVLHCAVVNQRLSVSDVQWVLSLHPAAASTTNQYGDLPLHRLVWKHESLSTELVDVLVAAHPAAAEMAGHNGNLLLHSACCNPRIGLTALRHVVALRVAAASTTSWTGRLPLHLLVATHEALNAELVGALMEVHPAAVGTTDSKGLLPLHYACCNPRIGLAALRHVASLHPRAACTANCYGNLPLHLLVMKHESLSAELVDTLVRVHPAAVEITGQIGNRLLHSACCNPHIGLAALQHVVALRVAAASTTNHTGDLPLHLLVWKHISPHAELVDCVLDAYPAAIEAMNQSGSLPLHYACCNQCISPAALRHLASLHPAAASTADHDGNLPLHLLVSEHKSLSVELLDALVDAHTSAVETAGHNGNFLLHWACCNPRIGLASLRYVASLQSPVASTANYTGDLPLHLLVWKHQLLAPNLVDALVDMHPAAVATAGQIGNQPLHWACYNPHISLTALRHLVSLHPAAASAANHVGDLPLHLLVWRHESLSAELVEAVLEAHPTAVETAGHNGNLPLHCACGNPRIGVAALRHVASLHPAAASTANSGRDLPLHLLVWKHKSLSAELVDALVEAHPAAVETAGQNGNLPLHLACYNPRIDVTALRHLAFLYPAAASTSNHSGVLPLRLLVCKHESLSVALVDALVEMHPAAVQTAGQNGNLPLHSACCNPRISLAALRHVASLHPAAASTRDATGELPLHLLVWKHVSLSAELVEAMLEAHPTAVEAASQDGNLPLHCACGNPRIGVAALRHVASLHPAAASTANSGRDLPLHLLVWKHKSLSAELVDALVEAHPAAVETAGQNGNLPLHLACYNPRIDVTALRHLAFLYPAAASTANQYSDLPLHLLVCKHESLSVALVNALVEMHSEAVQTEDRGGRLPLHLACCIPRISLSVLRHVVSLHPAAASTPDRHGNLPLHLLVCKHESLSAELVDALVEVHPAAVQTKNQNGSLPLHWACCNERATTEAVGSLIHAHSAAAVTAAGSGELPYHHLRGLRGMDGNVRTQIARLLMQATDSLFPPAAGLSPGSGDDSRNGVVGLASPSRRAPAMRRTAGPSYVQPPPDARWSVKPHPLSAQGRLRVGLHVAIRGREKAWQFQAAGVPTGRAVNTMSLASVVQAGHRSLLRQRLARPGTGDLDGLDAAVLRALEHGHDEAVQDLLASAGVLPRCRAKSVCDWLGALMRHPQLDHDWLVRWIRTNRDALGVPDMDWLCLGAAASSGRLSLVQRLAARVQGRGIGAHVSDEQREQLAARAAAGGSVEVLRWLQGAHLATFPTRDEMGVVCVELARHDRLEVLEQLHSERGGWSPGMRVVSAAAEHGAIRMLRWVHVHTQLRMGIGDMAVAVRGGHAAVVQFLYRHRNITSVADDVLSTGVSRSAPGTLAVVEYVLGHDLCPGGVTRELVVSACTAGHVRVDVVGCVVSRASESVLREAEEIMRGAGDNGAVGIEVLSWVRSRGAGD